MNYKIYLTVLFASLLSTLPVWATPIITEFMAGNESALLDGKGNASDWLEIFNPDDTPIELAGWYLTDQTNDLTQWTFPTITLAPGDFLIVFASGKNDQPYFDGTYWHTNFKLALGGEALALVAPDGTNIVSQFSPFPPQVTDHSFGFLWQNGSGEQSLTAASIAEVHVPTNGVLSTNWTSTGFAIDARWQISANGPGIGFDLDQTNSSAALVAAWSLDDPSGSSTVEDSGSGGFAAPTQNGLTLGGGGAQANTGTSANFNNTQLSVPYAPALNPTNFTFATWVRPASGGSGHRAVVTDRMDDGITVRGFILYITPDNIWSYWTGGGGGPGSWNTLNGPAVVFDQWIHVAIAWDQATTTKTLYLNGTVAAQTSGQNYVPNIARDFHIGAGADTGNSFRWRGDIDEVILWNEDVGPAALASHIAHGNASATAISFGPLIDLDLQTQMDGLQSSAYLRLPFDVNDPLAYDQLALNLHFDDGFVAYLNGQPVASSNAPAISAWNSTADFLREDADGLTANTFDLTPHLPLLQAGTNVLAIHGLNRDASEPDFLLRPELTGSILGAPGTNTGYFATTTPRAQNPASSVQPGPAITKVEHTPDQPMPAQILTVTATVLPRLAPIDTVTLFWQINYGAVQSQIMTNDPSGIFSTQLTSPAGGDMLRWYVEATDTAAGTSRNPAFLDQTGNNRTPEFYGTFVQDTSITSLLPILYWRTENVAGSNTRLGARASVFYEGQFYDNIFVRQRGGFTSTGSQKFDFNKGDPIYVNEKIGKVGELNLNTSGRDDTFIRQPLGFQMYEAAEVAAPDSFNVLMVRNGAIQRVGMLIEQVDEDLLDRFGHDPEGALYKFVQRANLDPMLNDTITGVEKKTREFENFDDIDDFIDAIKNGTLEERQRALFDRVDLPRFTNFMAAKTIIRDVDSIRKNLYMYRDTFGSGEWFFLPWDEDFTFGNTNPGEFANHPLLGDADHELAGSQQWNVLYDLYNKTPRALEMYGRRLRSLIDTMIDSPNSLVENRADELIALVTPHTGTTANNIKSWVPTWRDNLNNNYGPDDAEPVIPDALSTTPTITFGSIDFNPVDGQDAEYIELINSDPSNAVELTHWRLTGGVEFDFLPGTVIPAGDSAFVSPDRAAFRARSVGPTGDEGRFVIGNYRGHLNNAGEPLMLFDDQTNLISSITYTGQLTQAQQFLMISEIMHNPTNHVDAEYTELLNISSNQTLNLTDIAFTTGINFIFPTNTFLAPNERILVVKDLSHFATNLNIVGVFTNETRLDSNGEAIKLEDATGSTVHEFTYRTSAPWPQGTGLVLIAPYTRPDHDEGTNWRSNAATPGTTDGYQLTVPPDISLTIDQETALKYPLDLLAENLNVTLELSNDLHTWMPADEGAQFIRIDPDGTVHWTLENTSRMHARLRIELY